MSSQGTKRGHGDKLFPGIPDPPRCKVTMMPYTYPVVLPCGHTVDEPFVKKHLTGLSSQGKRQCCPLCKKPCLKDYYVAPLFERAPLNFAFVDLMAQFYHSDKVIDVEQEAPANPPVTSSTGMLPPPASPAATRPPAQTFQDPPRSVSPGAEPKRRRFPGPVTISYLQKAYSKEQMQELLDEARITGNRNNKREMAGKLHDLIRDRPDSQVTRKIKAKATDSTTDDEQLIIFI